MANEISIEDAMNLERTIFIDVRSPGEYNEATISNAINMPILTDEEREIVGVAYKQRSKDEAKGLGLGFASKKLEKIYKDIMDLKNNYDNIVIFCWRGGMRSKSVCTILELFNIRNLYQLKGGYKSYRRFVNDFIQSEVEKFHFIVLHGLTGVGKTHILKELQINHIPILDLEDLAQNAGSVFGKILFTNQPPSQKDFESEVFIRLFKSTNKYVVVESESKRIGSINVPSTIMSQMEIGTHILVSTNIENRVANLYDDYITKQSANDNDDLNKQIISSLVHLKKRLGNDALNDLILMINREDYKSVINFLIEEYYDPLYNHSINKTDNYDLEVNYNKIDEAVNSILNYIIKRYE